MFDSISETHTEYLSPPEDREDIFNPQEVALAYDQVLHHLTRTGYGSSTESSPAGNISRMLDWLSDRKATVPDNLRDSRQKLRQLTDYFETFFIDLSDRLLIEKDDPEFKTSWATLNQQLAADFLIAFNKKDPTFNAGVDALLEFVKIMSQRGESIFMTINEIVNGAKAQAALMCYFSERNWLTLAPDPENREEITAWDVRAGVDFIAISEDGRVLYIDAKSRVQLPSGKQDIGAEVKQTELRGQHWYLLNNMLAPALRNLPESLQEKYRNHLVALGQNMSNRTTNLNQMVIFLQPQAIEDSSGKISAEATRKIEDFI